MVFMKVFVIDAKGKFIKNKTVKESKFALVII
jgi:hypothetical protein